MVNAYVAHDRLYEHLRRHSGHRNPGRGSADLAGVALTGQSTWTRLAKDWRESIGLSAVNALALVLVALLVRKALMAAGALGLLGVPFMAGGEFNVNQHNAHALRNVALVLADFVLLGLSVDAVVALRHCHHGRWPTSALKLSVLAA